MGRGDVDLHEKADLYITEKGQPCVQAIRL